MKELLIHRVIGSPISTEEAFGAEDGLWFMLCLCELDGQLFETDLWYDSLDSALHTQHILTSTIEPIRLPFEE